MVGALTWDELVPHLTGVARVATVAADGAPHVAKVMPGLEGATVWIATRASSAKAANLRADPRIAVMWDPGAEVYLHGTVELVDDVDEKRRLWTAGVLPYDPAAFFGTPEDPDLVLLRVTPTRAVVMAQGARGPEARRWRA